MFAPLVNARRSGDLQILPLDLPGFGAEPLRETSIATLAECVNPITWCHPRLDRGSTQFQSN